MIEFNEQEKNYLEDLLRHELETEVLSNTSQKIIINILEKLKNENY